MGQFIIHQEDNRLELSGILLKVGDQVEILHLDSWLSGTIAYDQQGWYFLTNKHGADIRLHTGLTACLTKLLIRVTENIPGSKWLAEEALE